MAMGSGISIMGKNTDLDANQVGSQQELINKLLMQSLQAPKTPELSWTQGAARMAEMLVSAYKQKQLQKKQDLYNQNRQNSMSSLAQALAGGNPQALAAVTAGMKDPQSQMMALQMLSQQQQNRTSMDQEMRKHQWGIEKDDNRQRRIGDRQKSVKEFENNIDPIKSTQMNLAKTNDAISAVQGLIDKEQDPGKQQHLQKMLSNLQQTQLNYTNQIRGGKGDIPDAQKESLNSAYESMKGGTPTSNLPVDQKVALDSHGMNPLRPESTANIENAKFSTKQMDDEIKALSQQFKSSQDMASKGNQILQVIAADPNLKGGYGAETLATIQGTLHQYFPGYVPSNSWQQLFQKMSKQLTVDASGIMRGEAGSSFRLTQGEMLNIVSKTVPDVANNSVDGFKYIIEATNAMNEPIRQALSAAQAIRDNPNLSQAQKNEAFLKVQQAAAKDTETAGLNFVNAKLAPKGQKIELNPDYDSVKNPVEKYIKTSMPDQATEENAAQAASFDQKPQKTGDNQDSNKTKSDYERINQVSAPDQSMANAQQPQTPPTTPISYQQPDATQKQGMATDQANNYFNAPVGSPPQPQPVMDQSSNPPQMQPPPQQASNSGDAMNYGQDLPPLPQQQSFDPNSPQMLAALLAKKNQQQQVNPDLMGMGASNYQDYGF